jgi:hypothetical protein
VKVQYIGVPLLVGAVNVASAADVEIYPYQPVVISIPHNTNHLESTFFTEAIVTSPDGGKVTNQVERAHVIGVVSGHSIVALFNSNTNCFVAPGNYQVKIEESTKSISVLMPTGDDTNVVPILDDMTLYRIILTLGRESLSAEIKAKCEQILALSPTGQYSPYARAYLAIDALFSELAGMVEIGTEPDFSIIGNDIVSLSTPEGSLKWTVLYHKGYAFGMRQDAQSAINAFTTLTNDLKNSPWSGNAVEFLSELTE